MIRKNQQLEKFSNALIEQRAFKFFRIDPAKIRIECDIMDHWSANIAKTEFDILRSRIEEQTGLISYYKNRGDDYIRKILSIERDVHEVAQKKQKLEADLNELTEKSALKEQELNQTINGRFLHLVKLVQNTKFVVLLNNMCRKLISYVLLLFLFLFL